MCFDRTDPGENERLRNMLLSSSGAAGEGSSFSRTSSQISNMKVFQSLLRELSFWEVSTQHMEKELPALDESSFSYSVSSSSEASSSYERRRRRRRSSPKNPSPQWKTATDPRTGKTYYYDSVTRRTQWNKVRLLEALRDAGILVLRLTLFGSCVFFLQKSLPN